MDPEQWALVEAWILPYRYWILIPLSLVEGPILMTLSGVLLRLGFFDFWPLYLTLMFGDLITDVGWYGVGRKWGERFIRRFGKYFSIAEDNVGHMIHIFQTHPSKILFLSKITMGFGFALVTLMAAGMSRIPLRKFIWFNFLGQIIWTGFLLAVGYFFGTFYERLNQGFKALSIFAFVIIVSFLLSGAARYFRKRAQNEQV